MSSSEHRTGINIDPSCGHEGCSEEGSSVGYTILKSRLKQNLEPAYASVTVNIYLWSCFNYLPCFKSTTKPKQIEIEICLRRHMTWLCVGAPGVQT